MLKLPKNATVKDYLVIGLACIAGIGMVAAAIFYSLPKTYVSVGGATAEAIPNPKTLVSKQETNKAVDNLVRNKEFKNSQSPFAALPKSNSDSAVQRVQNTQISPQELPKINLNSVGNMSTPKITGLPTKGIAKIVEVSGIIISNNGKGNIAILTDGKKQESVIEGKESVWGIVSEINNDGVVLDGKFIALNRKPKQIDQ